MATQTRTAKPAEAAKKPADVAAKPAEAAKTPPKPTVDYAALVAPSTGIEKVTAPNPLKGFVARTVEGGPLMLPVANAEQSKEVTNFLRRDAAESKLGLRIQYKRAGKLVDMEQAAEVHFTAKKRKQLSYTADDVKKWAIEQGLMKDGDKLNADIRKSYRDAHGLTREPKTAAKK